MALPPVLHDFDVTLSHVDRSLDQRLAVRTARHPSELMPRLWLRVLAYCLHFEERIAFGPGLCDPEAPDLEAFDLVGERTLWIRVGKAEPSKIQRVADRNPGARICVLFESPERMAAFVEAARAEGLKRMERLELAAIDPQLLAQLAESEQRRAKLSLTIVGDHFYVERDGRSIDGPLERASLA
jgi:uncharacterized protein YaeQ